MVGSCHQFDANFSFTSLFDVEDKILRCLFHYTQFAVRHEVLYELLLLVRHQPGKVWLVLCVDTCHQFDVGTKHPLFLFIIVVCEATIPSTPKVAVTPCPLFLAGAEVVAGNMEHTSFGVVFVATFKIVLGVYSHIRCGHFDILIVGDVYTCRIVHFVVSTRCYGEG